MERKEVKNDRPYRDEDYIAAKYIGLDLDVWNDYCAYFDLFEEMTYE